MVLFNAPHWPWQGPRDSAYPDTVHFAEGGSQEIYAAMMKSLDDGIGEIMAAIEQSGLNENTILIFTNDNGGERYSNNGGLSKSKMSLWEGGIKVPALVKWSGKIKAGTTTEQLATTMDWTATILSAGGAKADKSFPLDGMDLMPIMKGEQNKTDRILFWRISQRLKQKAVRDGKWKYLQDEQGEYLFDLGVDEQERYNLMNLEKERLAAMKAKLVQWEKTLLPPLPLGLED